MTGKRNVVRMSVVYSDSEVRRAFLRLIVAAAYRENTVAETNGTSRCGAASPINARGVVGQRLRPARIGESGGRQIGGRASLNKVGRQAAVADKCRVTHLGAAGDQDIGGQAVV